MEQTSTRICQIIYVSETNFNDGNELIDARIDKESGFDAVLDEMSNNKTPPSKLTLRIHNITGHTSSNNIRTWELTDGNVRESVVTQDVRSR